MIYYIHLEKDVGRKHNFRKMMELFPNTLIKHSGTDVRDYDNQGFLINKKENKRNTRGCSSACLKLLEKHVNENKESPLIIFEDDIIPHKKIGKYFKIVEKFIKSENKWKLIYLGSSAKVEKNGGENKFDICKLTGSKIVTGGFGIVIHPSAIPIIMSKIKDKLDYPHDISAYGHIQKKFKNECFVCIPNIVIADVSCSNIRRTRITETFSRNVGWTISDYEIQPKILFFIVSYDNENDNTLNKIINLLDIMSVYLPKIRPVFVFNREQTEEIKNVLMKNNNDYVIESQIRNAIRRFILNYSYNYVIVSNVNINWITRNPYDIFGIFNSIQNMKREVIKERVYMCWKCNKQKNAIKNNTYTNGFSYVNKIITSTDKKIKSINLHNETKFYDVRTCNKLHYC